MWTSGSGSCGSVNCERETALKSVTGTSWTTLIIEGAWCVTAMLRYFATPWKKNRNEYKLLVEYPTLKKKGSQLTFFVNFISTSCPNRADLSALIRLSRLTWNEISLLFMLSTLYSLNSMAELRPDQTCTVSETSGERMNCTFFGAKYTMHSFPVFSSVCRMSTRRVSTSKKKKKNKTRREK